MSSTTAASRRRSGVLLCALGALLATGCASPLKGAIRDLAPDYDLKEPATSDSQLGHRRLGKGELETNACFSGERAGEAQSWAKTELDYTDELGGDLKADFGPVFRGDVSASGKRTVKVRLGGFEIAKLGALYFDPVSSCATDPTRRREYASSDGRVERVVTKAIRIGSIEVEDSTSGTGRIELDTTVVTATPMTAGVGGGSSTVQRWEGANLFVAHAQEEVRVMLISSPPCKLGAGTGRTCPIGTCAFRLDTLEPSSWTGTLTCQGGSSNALKGAIGDYAGANRGAGVSYSFLVGPTAETGVLQVEPLQWVVRSED